MSEYVLILALVFGVTPSRHYPAITSVMFPTQSACEEAKTAAETKWSGRASAICVPWRAQ